MNKWLKGMCLVAVIFSMPVLMGASSCSKHDVAVSIFEVAPNGYHAVVGREGQYPVLRWANIGEQTRVIPSVKNLGDQTEQVKVTAYITYPGEGEQKIGTQSIKVPPSADYGVTFIAPAPTQAGTGSVRAVAEIVGATDSDPSNNTATVTITMN
ncbi:MAG: hypothetical protein QME81_07230 [bacterium]|nr:hypothetical protein [bacterium]